MKYTPLLFILFSSVLLSKSDDVRPNPRLLPQPLRKQFFNYDSYRRNTLLNYFSARNRIDYLTLDAAVVDRHGTLKVLTRTLLTLTPTAETLNQTAKTLDHHRQSLKKNIQTYSSLLIFFRTADQREPVDLRDFSNLRNPAELSRPSDLVHEALKLLAINILTAQTTWEYARHIYAQHASHYKKVIDLQTYLFGQEPRDQLIFVWNTFSFAEKTALTKFPSTELILKFLHIITPLVRATQGLQSILTYRRLDHLTPSVLVEFHKELHYANQVSPLLPGLTEALKELEENDMLAVRIPGFFSRFSKLINKFNEILTSAAIKIKALEEHELWETPVQITIAGILRDNLEKTRNHLQKAQHFSTLPGSSSTTVSHLNESHKLLNHMQMILDNLQKSARTQRAQSYLEYVRQEIMGFQAHYQSLCSRNPLS